MMVLLRGGESGEWSHGGGACTEKRYLALLSLPGHHDVSNFALPYSSSMIYTSARLGKKKLECLWTGIVIPNEPFFFQVVFSGFGHEMQKSNGSPKGIGGQPGTAEIGKYSSIFTS